MKKKNEMTRERESAILEGAVRKFGIRPQVIVSIEALSTLQQELTRWMRGKGTREGLMDGMSGVSIALNQLALIFGDFTEVESARLERLGRLVEDGRCVEA